MLSEVIRMILSKFKSNGEGRARINEKNKRLFRALNPVRTYLLVSSTKCYIVVNLRSKQQDPFSAFAQIILSSILTMKTRSQKNLHDSRLLFLTHEFKL